MKLTTLLLFAFSITVTQIDARTWTHEETGRTIEADYGGTTGEGANLKVNLRIAGRGTIPYLVSDLSKTDQEWVMEQISKARVMEASGGDGDAAQVLGKWKGFMANSDGEPDNPIELEFTEEMITAKRFSGEVMGTGTYRIRGSGDSMHIDVEGKSGEYDGKDYEGIIGVEGKTLKWCSTNDQPSAKRPRDFQTDIHQNHFLMILKREE
ncbi:hypothetical protein VSU19_04565 [Verrucomicrobiales bacterium BCK34]|nr:hypothetical protein [Verrucomicrobiales bacterium BCK34]